MEILDSRIEAGAEIQRGRKASQLIRLRSQVEIEGLDEVADAEQIAQVRTNALNQQLSIQRDQVRILSAELQSTTAAHGANSVQCNGQRFGLNVNALH